MSITENLRIYPAIAKDDEGRTYLAVETAGGLPIARPKGSPLTVEPQGAGLVFVTMTVILESANVDLTSDPVTVT